MPERSEDELQPIPAEVVEVISADDWRFREYPPDYPFSPVPPPAPPRRRILLPVLLFAATCLTTFWVGFQLSDLAGETALGLKRAIQYSGCIMTILLCHEMGHFLQALRYGVRASFPYFIPIPVPPLGTMGAVIVMQARMGSRKTLFDIGITGPLAGLIPTLLCCILGIYWSDQIIPKTGLEGILNTPLLFDWLANWLGKSVPKGHCLVLHPVAYAGWVGLLITSLNLIPISQLDGGHVLYALLRRKSYLLVFLLLVAAIIGMIVLGLWQWTLMIFLLLLIGPFHPPTANDHEPLGLLRIVLGVLILAFIPLGFTPQPFTF